MQVALRRRSRLRASRQRALSVRGLRDPASGRPRERRSGGGLVFVPACRLRLVPTLDTNANRALPLRGLLRRCGSLRHGAGPQPGGRLLVSNWMAMYRAPGGPAASRSSRNRDDTPPLDPVAHCMVYALPMRKPVAPPIDAFDLTIGQLAERAAVRVGTVRYYERTGVLPRAPRKASGYRRYGADAVERLRFIRAAQTLGFTLAEIRELLSLRVQAGASCADVRARTQDKIATIDARISELWRIRAALVTLASRCAGSGPTSECPILDALHAEVRR